LTLGIAFGAFWAYIELGWGGFWAWDPVENASLLPWLTATAYLHSALIQERKGILKLFNIWLVVLSYALTVFGTFLTRSGVVQSVHAFASTGVGSVFLAYLAFVVITAILITIYRRADLQPAAKIESILSREAVFLINNLILLSICFAVMWGVLFPLFSEAVTGEKQVVGIPFFNSVTVPLFLVLLALMGAAPLIGWRKSSADALLRLFAVPAAGALLAGFIFVLNGISDFYPVAAYALSTFVVLSIAVEIQRGWHFQRIALTGRKVPIMSQLANFMHRYSTRYGGYLVHLGVVASAIAITASTAFKTEHEFLLGVGETHVVDNYSLSLQGLSEVVGKNYNALTGNVLVKKSSDGSIVSVLNPELRVYRQREETTTEVALKSSLSKDIYLVLAGFDSVNNKGSFKVLINPLQVWLWAGVGIMLLGAIVALLPRYSPIP
jgi:cytochrome c-type biogenesis protein CcmF